MLVHQSVYKESLKALSYVKITFIKLSNVVCLVKVKHNLFCVKEYNEELLGVEIPLSQCYWCTNVYCILYMIKYDILSTYFQEIVLQNSKTLE